MFFTLLPFRDAGAASRWRALLSTRLTLFSNDSSIVRPGWHSSSFFCARSTNPFTSFFDSSIVRTMSSIVFASAIVSPMPIEYERWRIQWLITRCHAPMKARAAVGPCSFMIVWISPPLATCGRRDVHHAGEELARVDHDHRVGERKVVLPVGVRPRGGGGGSGGGAGEEGGVRGGPAGQGAPWRWRRLTSGG